jgi:hypothetical protein
MTFFERFSLRRCLSTTLLAAGCIVLPIASATAYAQSTPRVQVFGGYSYFRFDTTKIGFANNSNLNGANVSGSFNFTHMFGVTVDGGAHYGDANSLYTVMAGPQITFRAPKGTAFAHGLFGLAKDRVNIGFGDSDRHLSWAVGGGYDYALTPRFSIRVAQVDYVYTKLFNVSQNNIRASVGVVYRWGGTK